MTQIDATPFGEAIQKAFSDFSRSMARLDSVVREANQTLLQLIGAQVDAYEREVKFYLSLPWYRRIVYSIMWDIDDIRMRLGGYWRTIEDVVINENRAEVFQRRW